MTIYVYFSFVIKQYNMELVKILRNSSKTGELIVFL